MTLRFGLRPFRLNNSKNKYSAVITNNETVSEKEIIEAMIAKGSIVSKAEALAVIEEYETAVCKAIEEGKNVNTRMYKIHAVIKGIFESEKEIFDSKKHSVQINIKAGNRLKQCVENIEVEKLSLSNNTPLIHTFLNLHTKQSNQRFSSSHVISLREKKLKFDPQDSNQGIFFVNENGLEFRVDSLIKNKPSELMFIVAEKISGHKFILEIRCLFPNTTKPLWTVCP